jgi:hypothetical protein
MEAGLYSMTCDIHQLVMGLQFCAWLHLGSTDHESGTLNAVTIRDELYT